MSGEMLNFVVALIHADHIFVFDRFQCRTMKAVALNDNNRFDVVRFASSQSDRMFQKFREDGMFVGADAYYCCFDHPDRGLRGSLKTLPLVSDVGRITDLQALDQLLEDLLVRGMMMSDASGLQILVAYKISFQQDEMAWILQTMFEKMQCNKVCMLSEPSLLCRSVSMHPQSCVVVDIGEMQTRVYVFFEGLLVDTATKVTNVGGNHLTDFMALLLHAQHVENYGTLLPRRCKEVAREVKERMSFVAIDFMQAQELYGYFEFESVRVMRPELLEASYQQGLLKYDPAANSSAGGPKKEAGVKATRTKLATEIRKNVDIRLPDGVIISFLIDVERFNCTEVLFMPALFEDCRESNGIIDEIVAAVGCVDESICEEVCSNIIIAGGSRTIPGLSDRIEHELRQRLKCVAGLPEGFVHVAGSQNDGAVGVDERTTSVMFGAANRIVSAQNEEVEDEIDVHNFLTSIDYESEGSAALVERLL
jgi:hypothetical protein